MAKLGDPKSGLEILERAIPYTQRKGLMLFQLGALLVKAGILVDQARCEEAQPLFELIVNEARRRGLPEIEARCMLIQAQCLLRQDCPEQAAQTARQAADTARSIALLPIEIEACSLWLRTAAVGLEEKTQMLSRFQQCLGSLVKHAQTPPLNDLLAKKQKAWTESPEK
jgi:hypothetical protein